MRLDAAESQYNNRSPACVNIANTPYSTGLQKPPRFICHCREASKGHLAHVTRPQISRAGSCLRPSEEIELTCPAKLFCPSAKHAVSFDSGLRARISRLHSERCTRADLQHAADRPQGRHRWAI